MKKSLFLFLIAALILGALSGCNSKTKKQSKQAESSYLITEVENVSATIDDISPTGATIVITDKNKEQYTYGEWYQIEKEENGKWVELETKIDNYGFNEIGYLVDDHDQVKFVIDWEWLYGTLSDGSYRIVKQVGQQYIAIPFGIATAT